LDNQPNRPDDVNPPEEPALTFTEWLKANGITLVIVAAVVVLLLRNFDTEGLWSVAKAALGLGFIIFIHELGHFLVAKWCDVHVTTFSIGFGPALPGCSFKWGETTYKLALFPLGGYVQMVGQVDGSEEADETDTDPRSYRNKTVGQRMAIISAGVVMNVILAFICFSLVFQVHGKERIAGVVAGTDAGSPAWVKGIPTGAVLLQIGDIKNPYFDDLRNVVVGSYEGEQLPLVYTVPGAKEPTALTIEPRRDREDKRPGGLPMIGIGYPFLARLESQRFLRKDFDHPAWFNTAAERATPPFEFGDDIVATSDPDDPTQLKPLPEDPRQPGSGRRDYFELQRRMQLLAGKEMAFEVLRDSARVKITVPPAFHVTLGVRMLMGQITAVREDGPGWGKVQPFDAGQNVKGDIIEKVEVKDASGKVLTFAGETLDPLRLSNQLRNWAATIRDPAHKQVTLYVTRFNAPGAGNPPNREEVERQKPIALRWEDRWRFDKEWAGGITSPQAVPELGIAYRVQTAVAGYDGGRPEGAPAGGLRPNDVIKRVKFHQLDPAAKGEDGRPQEKDIDAVRWQTLEGDQWAYVFQNLQTLTLKKLTLEVERGGETKVLTAVEAKEDPTWPLTDRGLILAKDMRLQKADNLAAAIGLGLTDTWRNILQIYSQLRNLLSGRIAVTNLAGPIEIAEAAYRFAGFDVWEFIFFLGFISVNLAVVNFLPIPVLDGGHMVFLLYEKLRGKQAPEGVRVGATYVGLLMLVSLMLFVIGLGIFRKLGWLG
jgi:regulator of sigma E protease